MRSRIIIALLAISSLAQTTLTLGAQPAETPSRSALSYIPEATVCYAFFRPHETLTHPLMKYAPTDLLTELSVDTFKLDPMKIESVDLMIGAPISPGGDLGFVVKMIDPFDMRAFARKIGANSIVKLNGVEYYECSKASQLVMRQIGPKEFIAGTLKFTQLMMTGKHNPGRLTSLASNTKSSQTSFLFAMDTLTLRPFLQQASQNHRERAPEFASFINRVVSCSDLVAVRGSIDALGMQIYFESENDSTAATLNATLTAAVKAFEQRLLSRISDKPKENVVDVAMAQLFERAVQDVSNELKPKRNGNRVVIQSSFKDLAPRLTASTLAMSLVGGIEGARTANQQFVSVAPGKLEPLGQAILEYEAATGELPSDIVDHTTGQPLLSWRVAILPFLGHQDLYLQFHLSEPWDSPHNSELSSQMPDCFKHPTCPANTTSIMAPTGPNLGVLGCKLSDIRDGASETIVFVSVPSKAAVHWTEPTDIDIPSEDPLSLWQSANVSEFQVVMADGSVRTIRPHEINPSSFYELLTPNGSTEKKRQMEVSRRSTLASSATHNSIE